MTNIFERAELRKKLEKLSEEHSEIVDRKLELQLQLLEHSTGPYSNNSNLRDLRSELRDLRSELIVMLKAEINIRKQKEATFKQLESLRPESSMVTIKKLQEELKETKESLAKSVERTEALNESNAAFINRADSWKRYAFSQNKEIVNLKNEIVRLKHAQDFPQVFVPRSWTHILTIGELFTVAPKLDSHAAKIGDRSYSEDVFELKAIEDLARGEFYVGQKLKRSLSENGNVCFVIDQGVCGGLRTFSISEWLIKKHPGKLTK